MNSLSCFDLLITFGSILIVAKSYLENTVNIIMSQTTEHQNAFNDDVKQSDAESCGCEKTTCAIGIASIAIGIGGFVLASLL